MKVLIKNYLNWRVFLDILSSIPYDYICIMILNDTDSTFAEIIRLLRYLKFYRIYEIITIQKRYSNINIILFNIFLLYALFITISHTFNCIALYISLKEYINPSRFD
jgi:hypothetical protein